MHSLYHSFFVVSKGIYMDDKVILRQKLLDLRMQLMFCKNKLEKNEIEEQINMIHKTYSKILFEEKSNEVKKGRLK